MRKELLQRKSKWISGEDMETGALVIVHTEPPEFVVKINPDLNSGEMLLADTLQFIETGEKTDQDRADALLDARKAVFQGIISKEARREYNIRMEAEGKPLAGD